MACKPKPHIRGRFWKLSAAMVVPPCTIQHHSSHQGWASWRALAKIRAGLISGVWAWRDRFRAGSSQRKASKPGISSMQRFWKPSAATVDLPTSHCSACRGKRDPLGYRSGRKDSGLICGVWVWCDGFWVGRLQRKACKPKPHIHARF